MWGVSSASTSSNWPAATSVMIQLRIMNGKAVRLGALWDRAALRTSYGTTTSFLSHGGPRGGSLRDVFGTYADKPGSISESVRQSMSLDAQIQCLGQVRTGPYVLVQVYLALRHYSCPVI